MGKNVDIDEPFESKNLVYVKQTYSIIFTDDPS